MGEQRVSLVNDQKQMQKFVKSLLNDVTALEYILENDWFESDVVRIGAEQEMVMGLVLQVLLRVSSFFSVLMM